MDAAQLSGDLAPETPPDFSPQTTLIISLQGSQDTVLRQIGNVYPFCNLSEIGGALVHALPPAAVGGMSERLDLGGGGGGLSAVQNQAPRPFGVWIARGRSRFIFMN